jgi:hypothetical protein
LAVSNDMTPLRPSAHPSADGGSRESTATQSSDKAEPLVGRGSKDVWCERRRMRACNREVEAWFYMALADESSNKSGEGRQIGAKPTRTRGRQAPTGHAKP